MDRYSDEELTNFGYRKSVTHPSLWFRYVQGKPRFASCDAPKDEIDKDIKRGDDLNKDHIRKPFLDVYYDAEFTGLHSKTEFISIGMISDSGNHFYAEFTDYNKEFVNDWIQTNVIDNLKFNDKEDFVDRQYDPKRYGLSMDVKGNSCDVQNLLMEWLKHEADVDMQKIRIKTDCYAYDWVLLINLLTSKGSALDMPDWIHYIPIDLSTLLYAGGIDPDINREEFAGYTDEWENNKNFNKKVEPLKHNALWDTFIIEQCFKRFDHHTSSSGIGVLSLNKLKRNV